MDNGSAYFFTSLIDSFFLVKKDGKTEALDFQLPIFYILSPKKTLRASTQGLLTGEFDPA